MSWAEENGIDIGVPDWYDADDDRLHVLKNGVEICNNCGSKNIKVSKKGNKYCADLCWVDDGEDEAMGMTFQDWRIENDHE